MAALSAILLLIFCIKLAAVPYRLNIGVAVEYQNKYSVEYGISITDDVINLINQLKSGKIDVDVFICLFSGDYNETSIMVIDSTNIEFSKYPVIFSTIKHAHLCPFEVFYDVKDASVYQGFLYLHNSLYRNRYDNKLVQRVIDRNDAMQGSMMYIYFTPELLTQYKASKFFIKANVFSPVYLFDETRLFMTNSLRHLEVAIDNDDVMDVDTIADKIQYHQLESNQSGIIANESYEYSYITSGSCNLWWPLNNTSLYVHTLPLTDTYDKIEKIIFICEPNVYDKNDQFIYFANITESGYDNKHKQWFRKSEEIIIDGSKIQSKKPVLLTAMLALASNDPNSNCIDYISLDISICLRTSLGNINCIGNFQSIKMNVIEGVKSHGNYAFIHPMINQIESRDELGLALSFLLPSHASTFIEIGVQDGKYSENILHTWRGLSRMILIDPWRSQNHDTYVDVANKNDIYHMNSLNSTASIMSEYATHVTILRMTSQEASALLLNNSIDIVYIDALHHFKAVMQDIKLWWEKIKPGGMIAGHDYLLDVAYDTIFTVKPAVDEFALLNNLTVFQTKDYEYPSWMMYKPIINNN